nr:MAG: hypothetical protein 2 [Tombusviridae sp.]
MDNSNTTNYSDRDRSNRNSDSQGGGVVDGTGKLSINREADVKKGTAPAVSNTYVAETMTVTNNYNF